MTINSPSYFIIFDGMVSESINQWSHFENRVVGSMCGGYIRINATQFTNQQPLLDGKTQQYTGIIQVVRITPGMNTKESLGHKHSPGIADIECCIVDYDTVPADATLYDLDELCRNLMNPPLIDETGGRGTIYEQMARGSK